MTNRWIPSRPEYYVQTGGMHENPFGVPLDEIVRMVVENPPEISAQVIFGKYVESSGLVFTSEAIERLWDRTRERVLGNYFIDRRVAEEARMWSRRIDEFGSPFHTGIDLARKTDWTVITTLDCRTKPARVVYWKRLQRVPWETIYADIGRVRAVFGPNILVDSTGPGGDVVMDALESRLYCPLHRETLLVGSYCSKMTTECKRQWMPLACCEGYHFSASSKVELVEHLRNVLSVGYNSTDPSRDYGWLRCPPIPVLEEEMAFYSWDDKKLRTDSLFSLALAAWSGLEDPQGDAVIGSIYGD